MSNDMDESISVLQGIVVTSLGILLWVAGIFFSIILLPFYIWGKESLSAFGVCLFMVALGLLVEFLGQSIEEKAKRENKWGILESFRKE